MQQQPPPAHAGLFDFTPLSYAPLPNPTSIRLLKIIGRNSPSYLQAHPQHHKSAAASAKQSNKTGRSIPPPSICGHPLIQCSLETYDLASDALPPYAALSYTWDTPEPDWLMRGRDATRDDYGPGTSWPVCVDGRLFLVRKNLFEALQQFRPDNRNHQKAKRSSSEDKEGEEGEEGEEEDVDYALIEAAENGDLVEVRRLLARGASVGALDGWGETALHYAAENGHYEVVKELVMAGAQVGLFDLKGRTPLQCAMQYRKGADHSKVKKFLWDEKFRRKVLRLRDEEEEEWRRLSRSEDEEEGDESWDEDDSETDSDRESGTESEDELDRGERMLWIDALCINQDDLEERAAQVKIMPQIYDRADEVLVWLGTGLDRAWRLQRAISRVNKADGDLDELARKWRNSLEYLLRHGMGPGENELPEGCILAPGEVEELSHWLTRSYFTRTWVVQELSLAKRVRMFSGPYEFCWPDVLKFLGLLARVGYFDNSTFWRIDNGKRSEDNIGGDSCEAWKLAEIRLRTRDNASEWALLEPIFANHCSFDKSSSSRKMIWRAGHRRLSLPIILSLCWTFQSKDPRDKIFALLTIAQPLPEPDQIAIDYSVPVHRLFTSVAHLFMRGSGDDAMYVDSATGAADFLEPLEGLSYVQIPNMGHRTRIPGMPSWTPEFSTPLTTTRLWRRSFSAAASLGTTVVPSPEFGPHPDDNAVMRVKARVDWDEVAAVEDLWQRDEKLTIDVPPWLEVLLALLPPDGGGTYGPTGECGMRALCRTLMADKLWDEADADTQQHVRDSFRDFLAWELAYELEDETGNVCHPHDRVWNLVTEARQRVDNVPPSPSSCVTAEDGDADKAEKSDAGRFFMPSVEEIGERGKQFSERCAEGGFRWCNYHALDCVTYDDGTTFRSAFLRVYRKRALFRTAKGYLGLGPVDTKPGDKVALVAGARVPFVLKRVKGKRSKHGRKHGEKKNGRDDNGSDDGGKKRHEGRYKLVGEAYVHGIMHGEAFSGPDDEVSEGFEMIDLV